MKSFRFLLLIAVAVTVALTVAACAGDEAIVAAADDDGAAGGDDDSSGDAAATRPSVAGPWLLTSLTVDGAAVELPAGVSLDMTIEAATIAGNGGCNQFGGVIDAAADGSLALTDLFSTEMACEPLSILDFETVYLGALGGATSWEVTPGVLRLRGEGIELVYDQGEPAPTLALEATVWTFDTIFDGEGVARAASTPRLDKAEVTLVLGAGRATLTSEDCGSVEFAIDYEPGVDGSVAIPDRSAVAADCDDPESNMHLALTGIGEATGFMIHESRLTFIGLPGETVSFSGGS